MPLFRSRRPHPTLHLTLLHLPRFRRLLHPLSRRHTYGLLLGLSLMLAATALSHLPYGPVWECLTAFAHGIGCIPLLNHIEPLWKIFTA